MPVPARPSPRPRAAARGRPVDDPACAGCAQLSLLRALRRAGLAVAGAVGCDPDVLPAPAHGPFALVAGAAALELEGPAALRARARGAGARLLVVADRAEAGPAERLEALLARGGAVVRLALDDPRASEVAVARAAREGLAVVAVARCALGGARAAPLAVEASRCSRCGACVVLACPAIADRGGDAMEIDAAACSGCALCAPLCRNGALRRR